MVGFGRNFTFYDGIFVRPVNPVDVLHMDTVCICVLQFNTIKVVLCYCNTLIMFLNTF